MPAADVLIVDDEANVALTMAAILEEEGYAVSTAGSGKEALERLRHRTFDVVLTDLRLEDLDGLAVLAAVRRASPDSVTIMLTGYASLESAVKALREGAYDYLFKPCDVDELKLAVARGVERRQLARQLHTHMAELEQANATIRSLNGDLQRRIDEATADLTRRVDELARARDEIAGLHATTEAHLEQLRALDRLKSRFLSMASHELKTPLAVVSGYAQIARRRAERRLGLGQPSPEDWEREQRALVDALRQVTDQAGRLGRLVDELLDVSRIESGRLEFRLAPLDLWRLAAELVPRMQTMTERHVLRLEPAPRQPAEVSADRDHLEQVLNNLLGNAIKYSPEGGQVTVAVTVAQDGREALLSVQDEGVGIPPDELEAIFGLFHRLESPAPRDVIPEGLGLGLYISREIIVRHGGRIWATSGPGRGSTFYVALPTLAASASHPRPHPGIRVAAPRGARRAPGVSPPPGRPRGAGCARRSSWAGRSGAGSPPHPAPARPPGSAGP